EIDNTPELGDKTLLNVYFDFDKYNLKQESYSSIKRVAKLMRAYPTIVIEIAGHTDSINRSSDPNYNIKLSQQRADEVKKALIKEGIDQSRIVSRGYGETRPIADNSTPEGRARNRRTEFIIIKK
ncbi:MAG: OmpA family protein, partial [Ignavibacteria bacterium]|nr:OmpA family protein [Ignavibacteria bacterium]